MSFSSPTLAVDIERYMSMSIRSHLSVLKRIIERGSIKIEDVVKLLESNVRSKSDIILFEVLVRVPSSGHDPAMSM
jgi:spermidine synthase